MDYGSSPSLHALIGQNVIARSFIIDETTPTIVRLLGVETGVEIDAYPDRQDLSPDLLVLAKKAGCRISFGTDSHGPSQLRFIEFAAASALRAGIARERILNFMSLDGLLTWVRTVRESAKSAFAG